MRLDQYLLQNSLAGSRERARALIMSGIVYVDGEKQTKAGAKVVEGASVEVRGEDNPYVSRGGLKLEKALRSFAVSLTSQVCMDVGASSGGFTDCMLQHGAAKVYAVDVGYGQLAWKLRCDDRVVVLERTNIRHLEPEKIGENINFFTIDVSFISLKLVFPVLDILSSERASGIALVKPQFEAGKENVGKNGVVRDFDTHVQVIENCAVYAMDNHFIPRGIDFSPIKGPKGNIEFLLYLSKDKSCERISPAQIQRIVEQAHKTL